MIQQASIGIALIRIAVLVIVVMGAHFPVSAQEFESHERFVLKQPWTAESADTGVGNGNKFIGAFTLGAGPSKIAASLYFRYWFLGIAGGMVTGGSAPHAEPGERPAGEFETKTYNTGKIGWDVMGLYDPLPWLSLYASGGTYYDLHTTLDRLLESGKYYNRDSFTDNPEFAYGVGVWADPINADGFIVTFGGGWHSVRKIGVGFGFGTRF